MRVSLRCQFGIHRWVPWGRYDLRCARMCGAHTVTKEYKQWHKNQRVR